MDDHVCNVLYVCYANVFRSPIAEYFARQFIDSNNISGIVVSSAGIRADPVNRPKAVNEIVLDEMLLRYNIDMAGHVQRRLSQGMIDESDLVVTMTLALREELLKGFVVPRQRVVLFNELCYGSCEPVFDDTNLPHLKMGSDDYNLFLRQIVRHIHDWTPYLINSINRFREQRHRYRYMSHSSLLV